MRIASLLTAMLLSLPALSDEVHKVPEKSLRTNAGHEIHNFPSIRSQDGVGLCYAFAATQLLNYRYCAENQVDCTDPKNQMSALQVSAHYQYYERAIQEGGLPSSVLSNLKADRRVKGVYSEECLPFEKLAHRNPSSYHGAEGEGYRELYRIFESGGKNLSDEDKLCYAKRIKEIYPLQKDVYDIVASFNAHSPEQFIYNVVVNDECNQPKSLLSKPQYRVDTYPASHEKNDYASVVKKIEQLVLNNIPVAINYCASDYVDENDLANTCGGHAAVITGVREACNAKGCKTLIKLHNSYGQSWQDAYNDGWIEAAPLLKRARTFSERNYLTFIHTSSNKLTIPAKQLKRKEAIAAEMRDPNKVDAPPADIDMSRKPMFRCDGGYWGDRWLPGMNCQFMLYTKD